MRRWETAFRHAIGVRGEAEPVSPYIIDFNPLVYTIFKCLLGL
jgi:hypothetical protein